MTLSGIRRAFAACVLLIGGPTSADTALGGTFSCPQRQGAGRVVCDLELPKRAGTSTLVWVDALVIKTPPFIKPLRSRVTVRVVPGAGGALNLPVPFVAHELGQAEISVRARAVACQRVEPAPSGCRSVHADFTTAIRVGL